MSIGDNTPLAPQVQSDSEGEWEDIPETQATRKITDRSARSRSGSVQPGTPTSPGSIARRRKATKTVYIAQSQPTSRRVMTQRPRRQPIIDGEQVQDALVHGTAWSVRYFGSVLTHALWLLKKPLGILLCLWMLGVLFSLLSSTIRAAFEPICWVPFISSSLVCRIPSGPPAPAENQAQWVDYPRLVEIQSSNFEQLLGGAVGGSALSLEIKKAEMATKDLVTLVKVSDLKSRDLLARSLYDFVEDAKKTGRGLQRLNAKINGAVDSIMAVNDHVLHTIESAQAQPNESVLLRALKHPFRPIAEPPTETALLDGFRASLDKHADELAKLVLELAASTANLDALDTQLSALHELCAREDLAISAARDALLSDLWTILGGNRDRLRSFETNLDLLKHLGEYRRRAAAHVAAAAQTVQAMGEEMEELRERVAAPDLTGDRIPIEVHMRSIRSGMERIQEQRIKARDREELLMNRILGIES